MRGRFQIAVLGASMFLLACRGSRAVADAAVAPRDLHPRSAAQLVDRLAAAAAHVPGHLAAKADISMEMHGERKSFKAHLRLVRDSAIWVSVTPALGIEVARVLLTPDSLKFIDKLHDQYWTGTNDQAQARFGVRPGLRLLQDALLGLPMGLDTTEKYRSGREEGMYSLAVRERRKFIRAAEEIAPWDTLPDNKDLREKRLERILRQAERRETVVYKYWMDPDSLQLNRVMVSDLVHDQQADVRYMDRTTISGYSIPKRVALSLSAPGQSAGGSIHLDRIVINEPNALPFRIPAKFGRLD
ncbi:MAG TPA: DUF4292 domain-containing protein [Flavobacteriales bacterium]|nr:DUF4292 domain-containing protein [Flavobacteriales bacterium]